MTDDMMNLRTLVEKTPDADLLREMIGFDRVGTRYESFSVPMFRCDIQDRSVRCDHRDRGTGSTKVSYRQILVTAGASQAAEVMG